LHARTALIRSLSLVFGAPTPLPPPPPPPFPLGAICTAVGWREIRVDQTHRRRCKRRRDVPAEAAELSCAVAQRRERAPSQGRGVWGVVLCWGRRWKLKRCLCESADGRKAQQTQPGTKVRRRGSAAAPRDPRASAPEDRAPPRVSGEEMHP